MTIAILILRPAVRWPLSAEDLDLTGDNLTRDDGPAIACLNRTNSLDLSNNSNWGDGRAQYLSQLKVLRKLSISGTKMTDKSLPLLSKLPGLKQVCVDLVASGPRVQQKT